MKYSSFLVLSIILLLTPNFNYQDSIPGNLPVKALSISAPSPERLDEFVKFMNEELATRGVNTLILRVDYNYEYESHPELSNENALTRNDVKKLVKAGNVNDIRLIPQINLLGHQSWHSDLKNLLEVYPQFDETPHIKLPENYEWPNEDGLYCKSYCPLHPEVHNVVFDLVDEICDVFEADAFHAGMDEVFYIGNEKCPRCSGRDKAELFAGEVTRIRNHLAENHRELWIWGDRLIDGKTTGIGMWEASMNNTHRAIDMIPKDVFICDWHYERADPTPVYFAMKGFQVAACAWKDPSLAKKQVQNMFTYRQESTDKMRNNFSGVIQTIWTSAGNFMDDFYESEKTSEKDHGAESFRAMFSEIEKQENME